MGHPKREKKGIGIAGGRQSPRLKHVALWQISLAVFCLNILNACDHVYQKSRSVAASRRGQGIVGAGSGAGECSRPDLG